MIRVVGFDAAGNRKNGEYGHMDISGWKLGIRYDDEESTPVWRAYKIEIHMHNWALAGRLHNPIGPACVPFEKWGYGETVRITVGIKEYFFDREKYDPRKCHFKKLDPEEIGIYTALGFEVVCSYVSVTEPQVPEEIARAIAEKYI